MNIDSADSLLVSALNDVDRGRNVDILGPRLSGRTQLVGKIVTHLRTRRRKPLLVRGQSQLSGERFAALHIAGVPRSGDSITGHITEVARFFNASPGVIVVDDWEHLDQASWGVLINVHQERGTPIVVSRVYDTNIPGPFDIPSVAESRGYRIAPVTLAKLDQLTRASLGAPLDTISLSRLAAFSGSNPGIAQSVLQAAVDAGHVGRGDGYVSLSGVRLWTPACEDISRRLIGHLNVEQVTALETVALLGPGPLHEATEHIGATLVRELSNLLMVKIATPRPGEALLIVKLPILDEYFLRRANSVQRALITEVAALPDPEPLTTSTVLSLTYVMRGRAIAEAARAWESEPTLHSANGVIRVLNAALASDEEIWAIFTASHDLTGSDEDTVDWEDLRLKHTVTRRWDFADARTHFTALAIDRPDLAPFYRAAIAVVDVCSEQVPDWTFLDDDITHLNERVRRNVLRLRFLCTLACGKFDVARTYVPYFEGLQNTHLETELLVLWDLCEGNFASAGVRLESLFRGVRESVDWEAMAVVVYLAGLRESFTTPEHARSYFDHLRDLGAVFAATTSRQQVNSVAVEVYGLTGEAVPEAFSRAPERPHLSPYPAGNIEWQRAGEMRVTGDYLGAARTLHAYADRLWDAGLHMAAAMAYLHAASAYPLSELAQPLRERVATLDARGLSIGGNLLALVCADDIDGAEDYIDSIAEHVEGGREAFTVIDSARARKGALDESKPLRPDMPQWTKREYEVVRYAATGLTNKEIAEVLTLSVRTVETHLLRAMRKAGTRSRQALRAYL